MDAGLDDLEVHQQQGRRISRRGASDAGHEGAREAGRTQGTHRRRSSRTGSAATAAGQVCQPFNAKYRDPEKPENTWAGRGKMPNWLKEKVDAGAKLEDFLIDKPAVAEVDPEAGF
ncbi:MAG: H-NS histone family protein [Dokdonella sp.]|nr:H-NS histone family protein [Dokdonella sp.]